VTRRVTTDYSSVNIRALPALNGAIRGYLLRGQEFHLMGTTTSSDGILWYEIVKGWVSGSVTRLVAVDPPPSTEPPPGEPPIPPQQVQIVALIELRDEVGQLWEKLNTWINMYQENPSLAFKAVQVGIDGGGNPIMEMRMVDPRELLPVVNVNTETSDTPT